MTRTTVRGTTQAPVRKIDHRKATEGLYSATRSPALLEVPPLTYLMADGQGDPTTSAGYAEALHALYAVSYAAKFAVRRLAAVDYPVMPLEGLWWADDLDVFATGDRSAWRWTMMIMQPAEVTGEVLAAATTASATKVPAAALARLRLEVLAEGRAAQLLHLGPYETEAPSVALLHAFIAEQGLQPTGRHHEIYLGDPRRVAPERLRTILRQPVTGRADPR